MHRRSFALRAKVVVETVGAPPSDSANGPHVTSIADDTLVDVGMLAAVVFGDVVQQFFKINSLGRGRALRGCQPIRSISFVFDDSISTIGLVGKIGFGGIRGWGLGS